MFKLTLVVLLVALGRMHPVTGVASASIIEQHIAGTRARLDHAEWVMRTRDAAWRDGLDPDSATFRLIQPAADYGADYRLKSFPLTSLRYDFFEVARKYRDVAYLTVGGFEWGVKTPVSLRPLFPRSHVADARVVPSSDTSGFSVEVVFSAEGLDALAALLGSADPVDAYLDWYAAWHRAGEPVTEMRAVVTFRNAALIPFSVNEVVARKRLDLPIAIAKGLTLQAAEELVGDLRK